MTAAPTDAAALMTGARVARTLLAVHLFSGTGDFRTSLRFSGTLTKVRLIHNDGVVKKLLADFRSKRFKVDLVIVNFGAGLVVNR